MFSALYSDLKIGFSGEWSTLRSDKDFIILFLLSSISSYDGLAIYLEGDLFPSFDTSFFNESGFSKCDFSLSILFPQFDSEFFSSKLFSSNFLLNLYLLSIYSNKVLKVGLFMPPSSLSFCFLISIWRSESSYLSR